MTIDDERAAFIRDLLRVLTSLYSWAGAVVNGQTEDGHDVIEVANGYRCWTEVNLRRVVRIVILKTDGNQIIMTWTDYLTNVSLLAEAARLMTDILVRTVIRDIISGPPEDA